MAMSFLERLERSEVQVTIAARNRELARMRWQAKVEADRRAATKFVQRFTDELALPRLRQLAQKIGHGAAAAVDRFGACSVHTDRERIASDEHLYREFRVFVQAEIGVHNDVSLAVTAQWQDQQGRRDKVVAQRRQQLHTNERESVLCSWLEDSLDRCFRGALQLGWR